MKLNLKRILLWCVMGIGGISLGFYFLYRAFLDAAFLIGILGVIFIIMGMWFVAKSHNGSAPENHDKF